jgi:hypothetical protein
MLKYYREKVYNGEDLFRPRERPSAISLYNVTNYDSKFKK